MSWRCDCHACVALLLTYPLCLGSSVTPQDRLTLAADLQDILATSSPATVGTTLSVDSADTAGLCELSCTSDLRRADFVPLLVDCFITFWKPSVDMDREVPFQLSIPSPADSQLSGLRFSQLAIQFNNASPPLVVAHRDNQSSLLDLYMLGEGDSQASLRWRDGSCKVFQGVVSSPTAAELTVGHLVYFHLCIRLCHSMPDIVRHAVAHPW